MTKRIVDGSFDYMLILVLVSYGFNYFVGIQRNKRIAEDWLSQLRPLIFSNFAVVGTNNKELKDPSMIQFEDVDINTFKVYAGGRENIIYCHFILELMKRQDFVSMVVSFFMCGKIFKTPVSTDSVWIEIPIDRSAIKDSSSRALVSELLITPRKGYYFE
jgi:hypothetical protein